MDDESANVRLLGGILQVAGLGHAHGAIDARQAVRRFLELDVDLMLLYLHMPHMDGYAVLLDQIPPDQLAELGLP